MTFSFEDLISIDEVIADVLQEVDDQAQQKLTPGFYRKIVKKALDELGFDVAFVDATRDLVLPDDLKVPTPKGVFNVKTIQVFTGTPGTGNEKDNVRGVCETCNGE